MAKRLRAEIKAAGGVRAFARAHRLDAAYVSRAARRGKMTFGPKIERALRVRRVEGWEER